MASNADLSKDIVIQDAPSDSVSDLQFSPRAENLLAASSWDGSVRIYDVNRRGFGMGVARYGHQGPVLACSWGLDGQRIFSPGVDRSIYIHDLATGNTGTQRPYQIPAAHEEPIRSIQPFAFNNTQMLVTGSWDKTVKYWDLRQ